jgi:hypothetical protein
MEIQERQVLDILEVSSHVHHSNQPELHCSHQVSY